MSYETDVIALCCWYTWFEITHNSSAHRSQNSSWQEKGSNGSLSGFQFYYLSPVWNHDDRTVTPCVMAPQVPEVLRILVSSVCLSGLAFLYAVSRAWLSLFVPSVWVLSSSAEVCLFSVLKCSQDVFYHTYICISSLLGCMFIFSLKHFL